MSQPVEGPAAQAPKNHAQNPAARRRISDHDPIVRPEYLEPSGSIRTIRAWATELVHDPTTHREKELPVLIFTDGKSLRLNATQLRALAQLFDDDEEKSLGQRIRLTRANAANGKATIKISAAGPSDHPAALPGAHGDSATR